MKFEYKYYGESSVSNTDKSTAISFAPDTLRKPTHFIGTVNQHIPFREAISALHDVVVSDLRFKPKDKTQYLAWLAENESSLLKQFMATSKDLKAQMEPLRDELEQLRKQKSNIMQPFYAAQRKYFDWLYNNQRELWYVFDPVITVHPDRVFFECFSNDESTYAQLSCSHNVFKHEGEFACGTTNIDYSSALYDEFQKIRDYKTTRLAIEPGGFHVQTQDDPAFTELKIDLPDTWVRGFLQVSSAMSLPAARLTLQPMDVYNICHVLRRKRERIGPRSMRFVLKPGEPIQIVFEPWNEVVVCRRSIYQGSQAREVRLWGRRRLLTLERLIAVADRFDVHLLGTGLPSFWVAQMPDMQYTLGLSGWTANDWSRAGQFDLMAPRGEVSDSTKASVYQVLAKHWFAPLEQIAREVGEGTVATESALTLLTQAGLVIFDVANNVYRLRELSREPLPMEVLRFSNPREELAFAIFVNNRVKSVTHQSTEVETAKGKASATVWAALVSEPTAAKSAGKQKTAREYNTSITIDNDDRLVGGQCDCDFYIRNKLFKGPCEHMLALRQKVAAEVERA